MHLTKNKINVAELLKDCPKGMELDCTMFDNITFEGIKPDEYPIILKMKEPSMTISLTENGCWNLYSSAKCIIFPKGKTTWEGFVPPCKFNDGDWITNGDYTWQVISHDNFDYTLRNQYGEYIDDTIDYVNKAFHLWTIEDAKDGDVLATSAGAFIYNGNRGGGSCPGSYCGINTLGKFKTGVESHWTGKTVYPATKEQRDLLFQKMKEAGYKWDEEKKELKKIEPKFKVGDTIKTKDSEQIINIITKIYENSYELNNGRILLFNCQNNWELVSNKFDINTLVPFESKVLVRDGDNDIWHPAIWGCTGIPDIDIYPYIVMGGVGFDQCIPYEGNEHLYRTTKECNEYYKTWE